MNDQDRITRIRVLNDALRTAGLGGRLILSRGVSGLPQPILSAVLRAMREFAEFSADNDPHGEHDFGVVEITAFVVFWKIDYYDLDFRFGAEDPSDPDTCQRVLTIMLPDEY